MSQTHRWLIAILMALLFLGLGVAVFSFGSFMGIMATDSCSNLPGYLSTWLFIAWPGVMLAGALVPPVLVIRKVRWRWVLLAVGIGFILSASCYLLWFPVLIRSCHG